MIRSLLGLSGGALLGCAALVAALLPGRVLHLEQAPGGADAARQPSMAPPGASSGVAESSSGEGSRRGVPTTTEPFRVESLLPSFVVFQHPLLVEELGLTGSQQHAARVHIDRWLGEDRVLREELRGIEGQQGSGARQQRLGLELGASRLVLEQACRRILSGEQVARLREVCLQLGGLSIFRDAALLDELAVSAEQLTELQSIVGQLLAGTGELVSLQRAGELSLDELNADRGAARREARSRVSALMSPRQRALLVALQGRPVAFGREDLTLEMSCEPVARAR